MDAFASLLIIGNDHQCLSRVKLLAELYDALQVVIENVLVFHIQVAVSESILITFHHLKNYLLVVVRALKKVLKVSLSQDLLLALLHLIILIRLIVWIFIVQSTRKILFCRAWWHVLLLSSKIIFVITILLHLVFFFVRFLSWRLSNPSFASRSCFLLFWRRSLLIILCWRLMFLHRRFYFKISICFHQFPLRGWFGLFFMYNMHWRSSVHSWFVS